MIRSLLIAALVATGCATSSTTRASPATSPLVFLVFGAESPDIQPGCGPYLDDISAAVRNLDDAVFETLDHRGANAVTDLGIPHDFAMHVAIAVTTCDVDRNTAWGEVTLTTTKEGDLVAKRSTTANFLNHDSVITAASTLVDQLLADAAVRSR